MPARIEVAIDPDLMAAIPVVHAEKPMEVVPRAVPVHEAEL